MRDFSLPKFPSAMDYVVPEGLHGSLESDWIAAVKNQ